MNGNYKFLIRCHDQNTESGGAEVYHAVAEGTDDVREVYCNESLVFEDRNEDILIYDFRNQIEVFTSYSGWIERSVFRKDLVGQEKQS